MRKKVIMMKDSNNLLGSLLYWWLLLLLLGLCMEINFGVMVLRGFDFYISKYLLSVLFLTYIFQYSFNSLITLVLSKIVQLLKINLLINCLIPAILNFQSTIILPFISELSFLVVFIKTKSILTINMKFKAMAHPVIGFISFQSLSEFV